MSHTAAICTPTSLNSAVSRRPRPPAPMIAPRIVSLGAAATAAPARKVRRSMDELYCTARPRCATFGITAMSNRREVLKSGLAAGAFVNLNSAARGANEKITLALIGGNNQGRGVAQRSITAGAVIKTLCDIDDAVAAKLNPQLAKQQGREVQHVKDFRRVLDDKSIDAVIIATPDHWHTHMALLACQAGKDVYLEKPVSQTIREGQLIRDAARKYNRIMQIGTMRRSGEHFRTAAEFAGSGKLGKICLVRAWMNQVRKSIGRPADGTPPAGADYDAWLGPAPKRPFNQNRFHYTWRFFWDYGNSELGNQGVHMLDLALWGIQKMRNREKCLPTRVSSQAGIYWLDDAKEVPDTQIVTYDYENLLLTFELRSFANDHLLRRNSKSKDGTDFYTAYYGTEGTLVLTNNHWQVYGPGGEPGPSEKLEGSPANGKHERNFLECVKSRQRPNSDVEIGRLS